MHFLEDISNDLLLCKGGQGTVITRKELNSFRPSHLPGQRENKFFLNDQSDAATFLLHNAFKNTEKSTFQSCFFPDWNIESSILKVCHA